MRRDTPLKRTPIKRSTKPITRKAIRAKVSDYEREFQAVRLQVLERAKGRCEFEEVTLAFTGIRRALKGCSGRADHVHHRKPRSRGGSNSLANCCALCWRCHEYIHANPAKATELGLMLSAGASEELSGSCETET